MSIVESVPPACPERSKGVCPSSAARLSVVRSFAIQRNASRRRHPSHRNMCAVQQSADNSLIPSDRDGFLFGNVLLRLRSPPRRGHTANSKRATCASAGKQLVRLENDLRVVRDIEQGHPIRADNQIRVPPVLHVVKMFVFARSPRQETPAAWLADRESWPHSHANKRHRDRLATRNHCQARSARDHGAESTSPSWGRRFSLPRPAR